MPVLLIYCTSLKLSRMVRVSWLSASLQAVFNTLSALASISPCRSMMAIPGWWRTFAFSLLPGTVLSFQIHDQFDDMVVHVVGNVHLIHHVLYQEQAPTSWRL